MKARLGDTIKTPDGRYYEAGIQDPRRPDRITVRFGGMYSEIDAAGAVVVRTRMIAWAPRRTTLEREGITQQEWFEDYRVRALTDDGFCLAGSLTQGTMRVGRQDPAYVATWYVGLYEACQSAVLSTTEEPVG